MSGPVSRIGTAAIVRMFGVMSSPVDLHLAQVRARAAEPFGPGAPRRQFLLREHVVQAEQPLQVLDRGEQGRDAAGDPLGRRVRSPQLRIALLQRAHLPHQDVVFGVGDDR
jgi:hypothetical protein